MGELEVLAAVAGVSGKNDKLKILQDNASNKKLVELLDATFNYKRKFYVNKFEMPEPIGGNPLPGCEDHTHDLFMELLHNLETRAITGHTALAAVESFFLICKSEFEQHWYAKVLRKDLKAGFSAKTAVKAGFKDIPVFEVMLAKDGKTCKKVNEIVSKGVYVSPKYDGYRCLAFLNDGDVTLISRSGQEYHNFPSVVDSLSKQFPKGKYIFDGEIMSDDFQAMQKSAFANKRGTTVGDVKFFIFGLVPVDEWETKKFKMKTSERLAELKKLSKNFDDRLVLVDHKLETKVEDILDIERAYIDQGYEGAMALPDIPYYIGKKSNKLLKFKTMKSQDCEIIGFYEGKPGTSNEGRLGGFIVKQENGLTARGDGRITDVDREYIWNNQDEFLGKIGEFKYQELTPDKIMRFPKFFRWRNDK